MKRILAALAVLLALVAPAWGQCSGGKTKAQLLAEIAANFPDNTTGAITPAILRTTTNDIVNSLEQMLGVNAQTGTTYTIAATDNGIFVTFNNGSAVAVTLPQATTNFACFGFYARNKGAGTVTFTPTTSTIDGNATFALTQNQFALVVSDGTNYQTSGAITTGSAGTPVATVKRQTFCPSGCTTTIAGGSSGTYTPSTGMLYAILECVGGGGGGGGAAGATSTTFGGGGGGGGGYSRAVVTASTIGVSKTVLIGGGGSGASAGANPGGNGSCSSISSTNCVSGQIITANPGSGGIGGGTASGPSGGAGGTAGTGDLTATGSPGGPGIFANLGTVAMSNGFGGASLLGGGANGPAASNTCTAGLTGGNYGGGGSGGQCNNSAANIAGGNGAAGFCMVTEFNSQ